MITPTSPGTLYLVATPIGNRQDISIRALDILKSVDFILSEDTRHTGPFLSYFGIQKPLISHHEHNENRTSAHIIQRLQQGESCALVSDAGTPLISDPGYPLVHQARQAGLSVVPIPGACALIAALSASGVPCETFTFLGFLPPKTGARQKKLQTYQNITHTLVLYESVHRIEACLQDVAHIFGENTSCVLAKELTKTYETFIQDTPNRLISWLHEDAQRLRGEFVLVIPPRAYSSPPSLIPYFQLCLNPLSLKEASARIAELTGLSKKDIYAAAIAYQDAREEH